MHIIKFSKRQYINITSNGVIFFYLLTVYYFIICSLLPLDILTAVKKTLRFILEEEINERVIGEN